MLLTLEISWGKALESSDAGSADPSCLCTLHTYWFGVASKPLSHRIPSKRFKQPSFNWGFVGCFHPTKQFRGLTTGLDQQRRLGCLQMEDPE